MKRILKYLPLITIFAVAFVLACGGGDKETPAAPAPAPAAPAVAPGAPAPAAPAAPAPAPAAKDAPQPKNPVGTIIMGRSELICAPGAATVFCNQYQADAWGAGEDLFTWAWRDDGTIDYAAGQLATSWDLAPDGLSVEVKIRQGVQFHKGFGTMTAEDVAWNYNQVNPLITTHSIAPSASYFSTLFGENLAQAIDAETVKFTFASVDSHWHTYMMNANGFVGMVMHSKKSFEDNGEDWLRDNFIATGPFEVDSWIRDDRAVFPRFADHWDDPAQIEKFIIQAMPEDATRLAALQTGELDAAELALKSVPQALDLGFKTTSSGNANQTGIIFSGNLWETENALTGEDLNTAASGVYARDIQWIGNPFRPNDGNNPEALKCADGVDPRINADSCGDMEQARLVRWAVAMAINKDLINTELLNSLGWPVHVGYADEKSEFWNTDWEYPYDVAKANEYLDLAGYPRGDNGKRFEMPIFTSSGQYGGIGEEIVDAVSGMMSDIGIETAVLKYPYAVYRPGLVNRAATIPRLTAGDDGQTIYPFDWPKGIEESSLSRGGYCMCYEATWISETYLAVAEENDIQKRIDLNRTYFDNMHFWALKPGVVALPNFTVYNPNSISEWIMQPSPFGTTSFESIVPAR